MALEPARIRALCFDVDGTLSDTDDRMVERVSRRLHPIRRLLFRTTPHDVARRMVMAIEAPGNFLLGIPDRLGLNEEMDRFLHHCVQLSIGRRAEGFTIVPGILEALECLAPRFPMAVVSARDEDATCAFLEQFGLQRFFQAVATVHTCLRTKPYPDPIRWAAGQMGISPEECLMIGDTSVDVRAGRAAGAQTIGVLCGFGADLELRHAGADLILPSTALVPDAIL